MSGEMTPMPLVDVLAAIGFKTATGEFPPGFDYDHALLTMVSTVERMRLMLLAHHAVGAFEGTLVGDPCPVCVAAQGAKTEDVLTDLKPPAETAHRYFISEHREMNDPESVAYVAHCPCGWQLIISDKALAIDAGNAHLLAVSEDPRGD